MLRFSFEAPRSRTAAVPVLLLLPAAMPPWSSTPPTLPTSSRRRCRAQASPALPPSALCRHRHGALSAPAAAAGMSMAHKLSSSLAVACACVPAHLTFPPSPCLLQRGRLPSPPRTPPPSCAEPGGCCWPRCCRCGGTPSCWRRMATRLCRQALMKGYSSKPPGAFTFSFSPC